MSACPGLPYPLIFLAAIAIPALMVLTDLMVVLAVITTTSTTTGAVHVVDCPGQIVIIEYRAGIRPLSHIIDESPSNNVAETTITLCLHYD